MCLSGSQEAPLTWLPPPVPCLNDGVMHRCQQVLVFFLFFVIGFIFFLRSKTIGAILCKNNTGGVTWDPRVPFRLLQFSGCTTLPVCADSSLLKVISSSITISFHISLSPSGENARCQSKWKFTLSSNKELNCNSESLLTGERGMKVQIWRHFGTRNAQVNFFLVTNPNVWTFCVHWNFQGQTHVPLTKKYNGKIAQCSFWKYPWTTQIFEPTSIVSRPFWHFDGKKKRWGSLSLGRGSASSDKKFQTLRHSDNHQGKEHDGAQKPGKDFWSSNVARVSNRWCFYWLNRIKAVFCMLGLINLIETEVS